MPTLAAVFAAAALASALAGCSADEPPAAAPAPALPVSVAPPVASSPSPAAPAVPTKTATRAPAAARTLAPLATAEPRLDRFVAAVQRQMPEIAVDRREEEVAAIGELACASRAAGKRKAAVVAEIEEAGVSAADARKLLTLAEATACRT
jgi:hypothetical protein